jgi:O-antigen/teichoic acid export membrane protein
MALLSEVLITTFAIGTFILFRGTITSAEEVIWLWGLVVTAGFLLSARTLQYWGGLDNARNWWLRNRDLMVPGSMEFLLQYAVPYVLNWVILIMGGAAALAGFRVVQLLFGALGNIAQALTAVELPSLTENYSHSKLRRVMFNNAVLLTISAAALWVSVSILPTPLGVRVFGESWHSIFPFLLAGAIQGLITSLSAFNFQALRILGEARYSLSIRFLTTLILPVASIVLGWAYGAVGVAWSLTCVSVLGYSLRLHRLLVRSK